MWPLSVGKKVIVSPTFALIKAGGGKFKGKTNKPVSYVVTAEGLYGVKCTPHMANGMVAIIAVGESVDKEAFLKGKVSKKAKARFDSK
jgi:hypothetical protein